VGVEASPLCTRLVETEIGSEAQRTTLRLQSASAAADAEAAQISRHRRAPLDVVWRTFLNVAIVNLVCGPGARSVCVCAAASALTRAGPDTYGLFELLSAINHSCVPNARLLILRYGGILRLVALRDIAAGEELTICYTYAKYLDEDDHWTTAERRELLLSQHGFVCTCPACVADEDSATNVLGSEPEFDAPFDLNNPVERALSEAVARGEAELHN
jgi:hypothetical protein